MYCGTQLPTSARFCSSCGRMQENNVAQDVTETATRVEEPVARQPEPSVNAEPIYQPIDRAPVNYANFYAPKKEKKPLNPEIKRSIFKYCKSGIVMAIAVVMLIMALLPTVKFDLEDYSIGVGTDFDAEIELSPIDTVVLAVDSFSSLSDEELQDDDLFQEMLSIVKRGKYVDDDDEMDRLMFLALRLAARSEQMNPAPAIYICAVLAILYLLAAVALFVFALLNLLCAVGVIKRYGFGKITATLAALVPALALLHYICAFVEYGYGAETSLAGGLIVSIIFALLYPIANWVAAILLGEKTVRFSTMRVVSFSASLLLVIMLFTPVISSNITAVFQGRSTEAEADIGVDVSFFSTLIIDEATDDEYDEFSHGTKEEKSKAIGEAKGEFKNLTVVEVDDGDSMALEANENLLHVLGASRGLHNYGWLYSLIGVAYVLIGALACVIMWLNLSYYNGGAYSRAAVIVAKILAAVFAVVALALVITYMVFINSYIEKYELSGYSLGISAGIVFMIIFAIVQACLPAKLFGEKKQYRAVQNGYAYGNFGYPNAVNPAYYPNQPMEAAQPQTNQNE